LNIHSENVNHENMLHIAVKNQDGKVVKQLLQLPNIRINSRNTEGFTPLHLAIKQHNDLQGDSKITNLLIIHHLLSQGAKFNKQDNTGNTAWELAQKHSDIIELFNDLHLIKFNSSTARIDVSLSSLPLQEKETSKKPIPVTETKQHNIDNDVHNQNLEEAKVEVSFLIQAIPTEILPREEARLLLGILSKNDISVEKRINECLLKLADKDLLKLGDISFSDEVATAKQACETVKIIMPDRILQTIDPLLNPKNP